MAIKLACVCAMSVWILITLCAVTLPYLLWKQHKRFVSGNIMHRLDQFFWPTVEQEAQLLQRNYVMLCSTLKVYEIMVILCDG